ncbi:DUF998 domain-containing protein [Candidatus Methanodesulfokora washburnensis]|uniref:DUF998 domain-containing protein n=1 Tax=Candidatus Methanodesulfokora washburnensis TaxID=2478471 RepID=A0A3R9PK63_9CREN|nr:DUF998 domain-containing protein [Candidatus Methanodesulfokores washburnensis]RSN78685.1 DUF998 domain-containing protein [Candidatus Methanodesulfokores washburnensis]
MPHKKPFITSLPNSLCARISAPVFNISVFVLGLTVVVSAYFLKRIVSSRIFLISLILCGIGAMGVGVFPENFGALHSIVSFITFFFGAISAIASYEVQKPPLYYFAVILGLTSLVALVLFAMDVDLGLGLGWHGTHGSLPAAFLDHGIWRISNERIKTSYV